MSTHNSNGCGIDQAFIFCVLVLSTLKRLDKRLNHPAYIPGGPHICMTLTSIVDWILLSL